MDEPARLFPAGSVVPAEDLVGRGETVNRWQRWLEGGQSLYVIGPRRIGKTSVAVETLRRCRERGLGTVFLDCMVYESLDAFAEALADRVLENETGLANTLRRVRQFVAGITPKADVTQQGIELSLSLGAASDAPPALDRVLNLAERLAEQQARRYVVVLDEFQAASYWSRTFYKVCRSLFQHHRRVSYLFLGSQAHAMETIFAKENEPFYGFAQPEHLDPVRHAAWTQYLKAGYARMGLEARREVIDELVSRTGGHPYETMRVANLLADLKAANRSEIVLADVLLAYHRTLHDLRDLFEARWLEAAGVVQARATLRALASDRGPYAGRREQASAVQRALRYLEDQGWVVRSETGRWACLEPMFRDYILSLHD